MTHSKLLMTNERHLFIAQPNKSLHASCDCVFLKLLLLIQGYRYRAAA